VYEATLASMTSAEISQLTIALYPPDESELDFAHIDLFTAENAPMLVWQPILDWIMVQRGANAVEEAPLDMSAR
jgi:hypothetical protein